MTNSQPVSALARFQTLLRELFQFDFFRRCYEDGYFLSLRRYGPDDVPYKRPEVMLHWANCDQYYVKTGEHFSDYRFRAGDTRMSAPVH